MRMRFCIDVLWILTPTKFRNSSVLHVTISVIMDSGSGKSDLFSSRQSTSLTYLRRKGSKWEIRADFAYENCTPNQVGKCTSKFLLQKSLPPLSPVFSAGHTQAVYKPERTEAINHKLKALA